ncbi:MAG TPA: metalloregulator ArsR/SmtB family transcription factor [Nocardia sp.]|uniref:ArsR/SmtB family transcription factor n=1 Tax=Nocardia TaxID=1817 RepID=UPI0024571B87|nr:MULTISPECIES: metalloregulator ArsR/SmtB family transcription factor [Nocardia]HLS77402.1 metalloregulator ArsR/SmtB family transcription factor [Nocardia sp.]
MALPPAKIFEALGDPLRRQLLALLATGERSAGELVAAARELTSISQPGVSQHLKVLREAGLVTVRADGNRRLYALDPAAVGVALDWLTGLIDPLRGFGQPLDALATEVARGKRARRAAPAAENTPREVRGA